MGEVFVGRYHDHLPEAGLIGLVAECANHIVGLEAFAGDDWYGEGFDNAMNPGQILLNLFGHGVAAGLVFGIHLVAEGGRGEVEGDCDMGGFLGTQEVIEGGGEAE